MLSTKSEILYFSLLFSLLVESGFFFLTFLFFVFYIFNMKTNKKSKGKETESHSLHSFCNPRLTCPRVSLMSFFVFFHPWTCNRGYKLMSGESAGVVFSLSFQKKPSLTTNIKKIANLNSI